MRCAIRAADKVAALSIARSFPPPKLLARPARITGPVGLPGLALDGNPARQARQKWRYFRLRNLRRVVRSLPLDERKPFLDRVLAF